MKIIPLVVGNLGTNCYLLKDEGEIGIIDPGDEAEKIINKVKEINGKPVWIVATHGHFDHVLAVSEISLAYKIPFYLNSADKFLLENAKKHAEYFTKVYTDPILVEPLLLQDGSKLTIGNTKLLVFTTPGHTPGSVSLYNQKEKILFCGDLAFAGGRVGRTDFPYASSPDLQKSIQKILTLPLETTIYPGHGPKTTLGEQQFLYYGY